MKVVKIQIGLDWTGSIS